MDCTLDDCNLKVLLSNFSLLLQDILTEINPEKTDRGEPIIQGDIVVPPGQKADLKGIINVATFWPNGRVSYNFHSSK